MAFKAPRGPSPFERRSASARDRQRFLAKAPAQLASEDPIGVAIVEADDNPHELGAPLKVAVDFGQQDAGAAIEWEAEVAG